MQCGSVNKNKNYFYFFFGVSLFLGNFIKWGTYLLYEITLVLQIKITKKGLQIRKIKIIT